MGAAPSFAQVFYPKRHGGSSAARPGSAETGTRSVVQKGVNGPAVRDVVSAHVRMPGKAFSQTLARVLAGVAARVNLHIGPPHAVKQEAEMVVAGAE